MTEEAKLISRPIYPLGLAPCYTKSFFYHYTKKQWGIEPSEIDVTIAKKLSFNISKRPLSYFEGEFQGIPTGGYAALFRKMLLSSKIKIILGRDYRDIIKDIKWDKLIVTSSIDEFYDYKFGMLPYSGLDFVIRSYKLDSWQKYPVINYPESTRPYLRSVECKKMTLQKRPGVTIISTDYPVHNHMENRSYPIRNGKGIEIFNRYQDLAYKETDVHFLGRLGGYRYINMGSAIKSALAFFKNNS